MGGNEEHVVGHLARLGDDAALPGKMKTLFA